MPTAAIAAVGFLQNKFQYNVYMVELLLLALSTFCVTDSNAPVPSYRQASTVAIIPIEGAVDKVTAHSFERRLKEASDADAVVIELNTPGGDLMSTLEICYQIKNHAPSNTVAWINPHAFSAGTIIGLACRDIIISDGGMFGDAAPINAMGVPLPDSERAKIESPILAEVIDSARRNHYDERLVEAFVSVGIELWLIEHIHTNETICVNAREYEMLFGESPPQHFTPISTNDAPQQSLTPFFQLNDVNGNEPYDPLFVQELPTSRTNIETESRDDWKLIKHIVPNDRLLTLKPQEATQYGLIKHVVSNEQDVKDWFGAKTLKRIERNWSEGLLSLLLSWPVRLALIALFVICIVVEFSTGTSGPFGIAASICMAILMGAPWIVGLAQWWDVLFVFLGLILIVCEVMIVPGTGFTGFMGVAFLLVGMVGSFVSGDLTTPEGQTQLVVGLSTVVGGFALAGVATWFIVKKYGASPAINRLVLDDALDVPTSTEHNTPSVGVTAVASTDLRPSGKIMIGDVLYDATTSGSWISQGETVKIIQTGLTLEVEEVEA